MEALGFLLAGAGFPEHRTLQTTHENGKGVGGYDRRITYIGNLILVVNIPTPIVDSGYVG